MAQRITLISCTNSKADHPCAAHVMYSKSPRFRLAYEFAKMAADKVFILSAKHGLLTEHSMIEPYNETLSNKSLNERKQWSENVIGKLEREADLNNDYFTILAGETYYEQLLPKLKHYWLPLKGKTLLQWIPALHALIDIESSKIKTDILHRLFNSLPRLDWTMINSLPYENGIYIMFKKGERYQGMNRIIRIGTHKGKDRLKERLNLTFG